MNAPIKLVMDCDPGNGMPATDVDDGLALALAWASPEVDLTAITVVEGNVERQVGARVATALAGLAGTGTPVYMGGTTATVEPVADWRSALARRRSDPMADRLWKEVTPRLGPRPCDTDAVDVLLDIAERAPGEYTLAATGPLTNVAAAERRRPGFLRSFARVVLLGGAFTGPMGVRELNFAMDPEAADLILGAGAAVTVVPLDITRSTWLTEDDVTLLATASSGLVRYLAATAAPWVRWITGSRGWPGANLHDVLAVAAIIDPGVVRTARVAVGIELVGELTRSRPVRLPDEMSGPVPTDRGRAPVDVVVSADIDRFMDLFRQRLLHFGGPGGY